MPIELIDHGDGTVELSAGPSDSRCDELFVFVAVEPNGNEGIMAAAVGPFNGAMVFRSRSTATKVEPIARQVAKHAGKGMRILRFTQREEISSLQD